MLPTRLSAAARLASRSHAPSSFASLLTPIRHYAGSVSNPVFTQLADVAELKERISAENSKDKKIAIIMEYPQLRELLETVYDPLHRAHLTSASLLKFLDDYAFPKSTNLPQDVVQLLRTLSSRQVTGTAAKQLVADFYAQYILDSAGGESINGMKIGQQEALAALMSLLDRNLAAGFGARTLSTIPWPDRPVNSSPTHSLRPSKATYPPTASSSTSSSTASSSRQPTSSTPQPINLEAFSCALGKSIEPPFTELARGAETWYASRKLDGVRVLSLVDFVVPEKGDIKFRSVTFASRTGNSFKSLAKLEEQLVPLERYPYLRSLLDRDPLVLETTPEGPIKRLVLDGEVCVMKPVDQVTKTVRVQDDGTGASALWEHEGLIEDFKGAVSEVRRNTTMDNPAYFLFDLLNWTEFAHKGPQPGPGLGKTFGQRVPELTDLSDWLKNGLGANGETSGVRALVQVPVKAGELDALVQRAAEESWEGLIFRADKLYKGTRSVDIRKFKKWSDAEYKVLSLDVNTMRLPIDGVFGEHTACARVWIDHAGCKVSVGSGFTAEERVRFAKDPSEIVGKVITVAYFSESEAPDRPGMKSLRFPTVKVIHGDKRDT